MFTNQSEVLKTFDSTYISSAFYCFAQPIWRSIVFYLRVKREGSVIVIASVPFISAGPSQTKILSKRSYFSAVLAYSFYFACEKDRKNFWTYSLFCPSPYIHAYTYDIHIDTHPIHLPLGTYPSFLFIVIVER